MSAEELAPYLSALRLDGPEEPFRVLADWLQSRGESWGKLIALQFAGKSDPALEAEVLNRRTFEVTWARGFARRATMNVPQAHGRKLAEERRALVRKGLGNPVFALLEALSVGGCKDKETLAALCAQPMPASVREVRVPHQVLDAATVLAFARWSALPGLKQLGFASGIFSEGGVEAFVANAKAFEHLEELDLSFCGYDAGHVAPIARVLPRARLDTRPPVQTGDSFRESGPEHRAFIRSVGGPRSIDDIDD